MSEQYTTIARRVEVEIEVKRSRFLARAQRVDDETAARDVIDEARKAHWSARHHCSAFVLGADARVARSNDDGEPAGTAGAPILAAITGRDLSDVVVVVTRYFGGVLLGAGGLVRAYGDAAVAALDVAGTRVRALARECSVEVPIAEVGRIEHALRSAGMNVEAVDYGPQATIRGAILPADESAISTTLATLSRGSAVLATTGQRWIDRD